MDKLILPNFICVGAQKSATTTLYTILKQHPDICLAEGKKETRFFLDYGDYCKGIKFYSKEYFSQCMGKNAIGEFCPEYMYFDYVPFRLYNELGESLKLIFILRNPIDRAYSHYLMSKRRGIEKKSFIKAIEVENDRIKINEYSKNHFSYINRGFYADQIKRYLKLFSKNNFLFIIFEEDFLSNRKSTISKLCNFLNVREIDLDIEIRMNPARFIRIKLVKDIIENDSKFKMFWRKLVPSQQLRKKIVGYVENLNWKRLKNNELDKEIKSKLFKRYYMENLAELEGIIGRNLDIWHQ